MNYAELARPDRPTAKRVLAGTDAAAKSAVLIGLALHDPDPVWVQERCLDALGSDSLEVRGAALTALGHVARLHRRLDLPRVRAALEALKADPQLRGRAEDTLDDIATFIGS